MSKYNTHLAAEFYVLSMLHRLGAEATLTLGNKKSVDIVIARDAGDAITVDVKGLAGKTSWPVDNFRARAMHYLAFLTFLGKIADPSVVPVTYIVPADKVPDLTYEAPGGRRIVELRRLRKEGAMYLNGWSQLL